MCTIAVTALALQACADDDDDAAGDTTPATVAPTSVTAETTTTTSAPTTTQATATTQATTDTTEATGEAVAEAFCSTVVEAEGIASAGPDVDFEAATEEEVAAAMEEFSAALVPLLDQLAESVPDEIASDLETIDSALRSGIETGDDPFSQPGFVEADRAVDQYVADNCGFEVYTVRAVDYAFEDVPATIESGIVGFELENEGREVHEMVLFRINDDVDLTLEELVALPEEESQSMVEFVTAAFAAPGESDLSFNELQPGRYGMLCFIPLGTTDMAMLEGEPAGEATGESTGDATSGTADATATTEATGDTTGTSSDASQLGPPHFTQGMMTEFEVVEAGAGGSSTAPSTTDSGGDDSDSPTTTESDSSAPSTTSG
jgi:hypothetical protein